MHLAIFQYMFHKIRAVLRGDLVMHLGLGDMGVVVVLVMVR